MDGDQSPVAGTPLYQESKERNAKWLWFLIILIILGGLVFAFVKGIGPFAQFKKSSEKASPTPATSFVASPSPEASPGANVNKTEPKIRVLNGSGKAGAASSMKDVLEAKGWKVATLGNATGFDFSQTILKFKDSFRRFQEALSADLSDKYSTRVASDSLDATDSVDIEVTVGSK